jgi:hypothetical protein
MIFSYYDLFEQKRFDAKIMDNKYYAYETIKN